MHCARSLPRLPRQACSALFMAAHHARFGLIGETYQQDKGKPMVQLGGRIWVVPERVQIDGTVGDRFGGGERWFSIGLRLLTPSFMR
jgi:hypothetical protein